MSPPSTQTTPTPGTPAGRRKSSLPLAGPLDSDSDDDLGGGGYMPTAVASSSGSTASAGNVASPSQFQPQMQFGTNMVQKKGPPPAIGAPIQSKPPGSPIVQMPSALSSILAPKSDNFFFFF